MTYQEPYISSSANGKLTLNGTQISYAHKNYVGPPVRPGYFTSGDQVGTVDFLGWENPKVVLSGVFDEKKTPMVSSLKAFAKDTTSVYIYDPIFFPSGTQKIQIETLSMERKATEGIYETASTKIKGNIILYSMEAWLTE